MTLTLQYHGTSTVPVEIEGFLPEVVRDQSLEELSNFQIFDGNRKIPISAMFSISGDPTDEHFVFEGELSGVHWIGAKMTRGKIEIRGNAGRHVGSELYGGEIHVSGDAGDWVGGEMHGGLIHVHGSAGHLIGAAYRGSAKGMTGGTILIQGSVGNEVGHSMRRGLIAIGGNAGDLIGMNMLAGTIFIFGTTGIRHGAGMKRGTIGLFGDENPELLSTFKKACDYQPVAIRLIMKSLRDKNFNLPEEFNPTEVNADKYELYHGDFLEGGRGEILLRVPV